MTYKILKSQAFHGFEPAVAAHAFEMRNWREHMARVAEDERLDVRGIAKHVAYPQPSAHPLVAAAVNESGVVDFEIVDDGPTPEQVLAAKKADLLGSVSRAEVDAIAAVVPAGKQRLFNLRESDIRQADMRLAASLTPKSSIVASVASAVGITKPVDVAAEIEKQRPAADTQHLADHVERRRKIDIIQRFAAQAQFDIEDLTLDNIDAWKMPDFPK